MSRIFISHSSSNNAESVALRDWLAENGWKDEIFLDLDPERGMAAGVRWEHALNEAANRCEAVLFLVSKGWLGSIWCRRELNLAHRLNKRLFGVLIENLPIEELPEDLTATWQLVRLAAGRDHVMLHAVLPVTHEEVHVTFSAEGLQRLKHGLEEAGLHPKYFAWPPATDPDRAPYRGLGALEAEDAGIFFGREGPIVEALDKLRGFRQATPPRVFVILGASGAGKSSFLRAGLFPRLARDDRNFLPLPVIRPERAVITGEAGLLSALDRALTTVRIRIARAELRAIIQAGAVKLKPLLQSLAEKATPAGAEAGARPPALVLSIDQGEELFLAETQHEAKPFLSLLRDLVTDDEPAIIVIVTIRSDRYEALQVAEELDGIHQETFSLPPMPKGASAEVIKGPLARLQAKSRAVAIEDVLVDALLADIETGNAKDALPLLSFTLERLYSEYHSSGNLNLAHYDALGRMKGSIEAAVDRALQAADADPMIPRDRAARLELLRRALIPWLCGIDPDSGAPRRRVARLSEIPAEARQLIDCFVAQRLLATDVNTATAEKTIEPAHEALLRQWGLLQGWLTEDAGLLTVLEGVKRASRDWLASTRARTWLAHQADRLGAAERLFARPDLAANLETTDRDYIVACRKAETDTRRGRRLLRGITYISLVAIIIGLVGWINQSVIKDKWNWFAIERPYAAANVWPYLLTREKASALRAGDSFHECASNAHCPEMIVLAPGSFMMGAAATEKDPFRNSSPQHQVTIQNALAVAKFDVTFDEWDACVSVGACYDVTDGGMGRGNKPVINVTWNDAQQYVRWLSAMTGAQYRLATEAEWEYAARAGTTTAYYWGDSIGTGNANCGGCGSKWDSRDTSPVGSFAPNSFGLYDMLGNVWQWVEDCYHDNYKGAPIDGSAWGMRSCSRHVVRGGSWSDSPQELHSAVRNAVAPDARVVDLSFRVARTLPVAK